MRNNKLYLFTGLATYTALLVLAVVFYKERTIFVDIAFHLFEIVKNKSFAIQNNRFGAFVTQAFPLAATSLNFSLKNIMLTYSAGFVLYYFAVFGLCLLIFKNSELALTMLLFSILMVGDTFYWIQSEFPQGLAFTILYFAALQWQSNREKSSFLLDAILMLMIFTLVFFHPLLGIVYIFITVFYLLSKPTPLFKRALIINLLIFLGLAVIKAVFFKTEYDSHAMDGIKNFGLFFPDYVLIESNKKFLYSLIYDYYLLPVFFTVVLGFYFKKREYLKLVLVSIFFLGYLLLVNVSYPQGADQFYIENLYLPLSIFLILPFANDVIVVLRKEMAGGILAVIIILQVVHIWQSHNKFTRRLDWLRSFMHETEAYPQGKLIVNSNKVPKDKLFMTWGAPYEFWLLSTLETGKTRSILINDNPDELSWALSGRDQFITVWGTYNYSVLPKKYFILNDSSAYRIIE